MCVSLSACISVCHVLPCAHGGHKNVGYSGTGVRGGCEPLCSAGNQPGSFARAVLITLGPSPACYHLFSCFSVFSLVKSHRPHSSYALTGAVFWLSLICIFNSCSPEQSLKK